MFKRILTIILILSASLMLITFDVSAEEPELPDVEFYYSVQLPTNSFSYVYGYTLSGNTTKKTHDGGYASGDSWHKVSTDVNDNYLKPYYDEEKDQFYYLFEVYLKNSKSSFANCGIQFYNSNIPLPANKLGEEMFNSYSDTITIEHNENYHYRIIQPDSDVAGDELYKKYIKIYVKTMHTHNYKTSYITYPTCTTTGYVKYYCDCGNYFYQTASAYGHYIINSSCCNNVICERCGELPPNLEHDFVNDRCSMCGLPDLDFPFVDKTKYTSVLNDLGKDKQFSFANYPSVSGKYELDLFQIAESKDGELFLYVYNPSAADVPLEAKYINMSLQHYEIDSPEYKLYSLTKLSSEGTITKYLVNNFKTSSNSTRYYNIVGIYTPYNSNIHDPAKADDDIKNFIGLPVGKCFEAITSGSTVKYASRKIDYVDAEIIAVGTVRYTDGFYLNWTEKTDSHFVAFRVNNFDVKKLYDVDVRYLYQTYYFSNHDSSPKVEEYGPISEIIQTVTYKEKGNNSGNGFLGHYYKWDRIQTVSEFKAYLDSVANEELIGFDKTSLAGAEFVVSFLETPFEYDYNFTYATYSEESVRVSDVTLLRMHFATPTAVYNLGVVSDVVSDDGEPDFEIGVDDNIVNKVEEFFKGEGDGLEDLELILYIILSIVVIMLIGYIIPIIKKLVRSAVNAVSTAVETVVNTIKAPFDYIKRQKNKIFKKTNKKHKKRGK